MPRFTQSSLSSLSSRRATMLRLMDTKRVRIALIACIAVFGLLYLWLINSSASAGFYVSDLENQVTTLEDEYKKLQVAQVELQSLEHLQQMSQNMQMVAAGKAEYVQGGTGVAFVESK